MSCTQQNSDILMGRIYLSPHYSKALFPDFWIELEKYSRKICETLGPMVAGFLAELDPDIYVYCICSQSHEREQRQTSETGWQAELQKSSPFEASIRIYTIIDWVQMI